MVKKTARKTNNPAEGKSSGPPQTGGHEATSCILRGKQKPPARCGRFLFGRGVIGRQAGGSGGMGHCQWRRGWDSNPRGPGRVLAVFKTAALSHSATPPHKHTYPHSPIMSTAQSSEVCLPVSSLGIEKVGCRTVATARPPRVGATSASWWMVVAAGAEWTSGKAMGKATAQATIAG